MFPLLQFSGKLQFKDIDEGTAPGIGENPGLVQFGVPQRTVSRCQPIPCVPVAERVIRVNQFAVDEPIVFRRFPPYVEIAVGLDLLQHFNDTLILLDSALELSVRFQKVGLAIVEASGHIKIVNALYQRFGTRQANGCRMNITTGTLGLCKSD